ncbi:hypothetical protein KFK09_014506 [Dendrobium nobile]|uniref:Uncharacterized protein n=1 Tax=Dendrobium nobile TaxID=94219 RepID=A0A8T3B3C3_DENNO|nr:hypothetical protein KFK09_014506 [Dendrobium nobile]
MNPARIPAAPPAQRQPARQPGRVTSRCVPRLPRITGSRPRQVRGCSGVRASAAVSRPASASCVRVSYAPVPTSKPVPRQFRRPSLSRSSAASVRVRQFRVCCCVRGSYAGFAFDLVGAVRLRSARGVAIGRIVSCSSASLHRRRYRKLQHFDRKQRRELARSQGNHYLPFAHSYEFFIVAVRLCSFDDITFLLDRKLRHFFDLKQQLELACCEVFIIKR